MRTMPEPVITISEMKRILSRDGDALEYMVKVGGTRCSYGYNVYLPQTCRPTRNKILFAYYAGSYLMFLEATSSTLAQIHILKHSADPVLSVQMTGAI